MEIMLWLFGFAGIIAVIALVALFWAIKNGQFDDPEGDANRILMEDERQNKPN